MIRKYNVEGMHCAACSSSVETVTKRVKGVKKASVSLLQKLLLVECSEKTNDEDIFNAIKKAGFSATRIDSDKEIKNQNQPKEIDGKKREKILIIKMIATLVITLVIMYFSMGHMIKLPQPHVFMYMVDGKMQATSILMLFLFILTIIGIYLNKQFYINGYRALFLGHPNMDTLVALGSSASLIYGTFSLFMLLAGIEHNNQELINTYSQNLYFDSAVMILLFVSFGKFLEEKSKNRTTEAIESLKKLAPQKANRLVDGKIEEVDIDQLRIGDIVVVKTGESVPIDGEVIEGFCSIDESMLTGESYPKDKEIHDKCMQATICLDGTAKIKVEKIGKETIFSQIIDTLTTTGATKAPIARIADTIAKYFVPIVCGISLVTLIIWLSLGKTFDFALSNAIAVLVISCPCALGLATPVAITVSTGVLAKKGVLIKDAKDLEYFKDINTFVFDKTGTLTNGNLEVTEEKADQLEEFKTLIYNLELGNNHPLAKAIVNKHKDENIKLVNFAEYTIIKGRGVVAKLNEDTLILGNEKLIEENGLDISKNKDEIKRYQEEGKTIVYLAKNNQYLGFCALADTINESAKQCIEELQKQGKRIVMISGDNEIVAKKIGKDLNINSNDIYANVLPVEKATIIEKLQKEGKVAFVGDGINDSVALKQADIGISVSGGSSIAQDSSDIVLMNPSLKSILDTLMVSKKTVLNIKENLFWALIYNTLCIPIAAGVLYPINFLFNPMIGAACMSVSSIFVVLNALRLNLLNKKEKTQNGKNCSYRHDVQ
ncbi:MAG: heavy metal translocating P-type ATPase [Clostridia bacterium]|nr:heavy metal translocating P-type ATPase [Clostridia bacterium]